ncbi:phosphotransferase [Streptomyces sp. V4-01]|uniref:Phosphotransferase n=1 Tax=Actinacidiphila polyblastidii TaxID=3110430 RepID=A0ABU7PBP5_9ACTN|nr:phosphotransferase [Streptomyces sp. V4-01]
MRERPRDLTDGAVREALTGWGIEAVRVAYAPVGFGDHHWTAEEAGGRRWFVTVADLAAKQLLLGSGGADCRNPGVDDRRASHPVGRPDDRPDDRPAAAAARHDDGRTTAYEALRRALDTASALREAGLAFVGAPERARDGGTLRRLEHGYALSVFRHRAGASGSFGDTLDAAERGRALDLLAALHGARPPAATPVPRARPAVLEHLTDTLGALDRSWRAGPYAEPARLLLARHAAALWDALARFDRLAGHVASAGRVVTHGEPHPGNMLRCPGGRRLLVDWDTVGLAPPERDLWLVAAGAQDLSRYEAASGHRADPAALAFYRLRRALEDVALHATHFRRRHGRGAETVTAWSTFARTLETDFPHDA